MSQHPIDPTHVPRELHFLIPYAERWGIVDSELLHTMLDEASAEELEELDRVVSPVLKDLDKAVWDPPLWATPEGRIFAALLRAKRAAWLKMTGWPENYPNPRINPAYVPPKLHPLIPYVEKWSIPDTELQSKLLSEASVQDILVMYEIIYPLWDDFCQFTLSEPMPDNPINYEVGMFYNFHHVFSDAANILDEEMPERWLEIIGWPDRFAPLPFDPARVPAEFRPLAPYIEKWVREDDSVRRSALRIATIAELEELLAATDQIGRKTISALGVKLYDDGIAQDEGVALFGSSAIYVEPSN